MGCAGPNARLSGRDVMAGDRRSPYCPSVWGLRPLRCAFPIKGADFAPWRCASAFSPKGRLRCDIMAGNVNQTQPEATSVETINEPWLH